MIDLAQLPDVELVALLRSDLALRLKTRWHAELQSEDDWFVPQIMEEAEKRNLVKEWLDAGMYEAARQTGHDVGLLTKAYAWYEKQIKG